MCQTKSLFWFWKGEARANNRKAKLIFFYEWELCLKWKGHVNGKDKEITGKIEIPNLSEEHDDMEDVDVDITISSGKGSPEGEILKDMMRKGTGAKMIRGRLQDYVDALKKEYSSDMILPKKDEVAKKSVVRFFFGYFNKSRHIPIEISYRICNKTIETHKVQLGPDFPSNPNVMNRNS